MPFQLVASAGQGFDLLARLLQQRADVHRPRVAAGRGFQRGQGQQVLDDGLHALGLLVHHVQVLRALLGGQGVVGHVAQRLQEAGQHRQRRAQLVRDIGDEVAAGGFQPFDLVTSRVISSRWLLA